MLGDMKKVLTVLLVVFAMIAIAVLVALLVPEKSSLPIARTIPSPNGYETLVDAGRQTVGDPLGVEQMTQEELRLFVADNSNALHLVRRALAQESLVPWKPTQQYLSDHVTDISQFKGLARTLSAEGSLAESEGRWMDAAEAYLSMVKMGGTIPRGGLIIDALVGIAIESMGLNELRGLAASLTNTADCRTICGRLLDLDSERPLWSDMTASESEWRRQTFSGVQYRIAFIVQRRNLKRTPRPCGLLDAGNSSFLWRFTSQPFKGRIFDLIWIGS